MRQASHITLSGYVTADPQLRFTNSAHTPVTTIKMGSAPRYLDKATGEWRDGETSYYEVTCWRRLAENVAGSLRKGDMITVQGRCRIKTHVEGERTWIKLEVVADTVGHDLSYGWARFYRGLSLPPGVVQGIANGEATRQGMAPDETDMPEYADDEGFDGDGAQVAPAGEPDGLDGALTAGEARVDDAPLVESAPF